MKNLSLFLIFLSFVACSENDSEQDKYYTPLYDSDEVVETDNTNQFPEEVYVEENSTKSKLLGNWQAVHDPTLTLTLTSTKFINFIDGKQNWNNDWGLSTTLEYDQNTLDDNGTFILVYLDEIGDVFYAQEVISITDQEFVVEVKKGSGGTNNMQTYTRIN